MTALRITLEPSRMTFEVDDQRATVPIGPGTLARDLRHDPPLPEELTNAIGFVLDHMEDMEREVPGIMWADRVEFAGPGVDVVADVELGSRAPSPFELHRDAAEDVYRTLVTERAADRARNPGLPAEAVHDVLGTICSIVGVVRFLRVEAVWLVTA